MGMLKGVRPAGWLGSVVHCRFEDFEISVDKIDLSDFKGPHSIDQITFAKRDYGVLLKYADDRLAIEATEERILVSDFSADDFIFA